MRLGYFSSESGGDLMLVREEGGKASCPYCGMSICIDLAEGSIIGGSSSSCTERFMCLGCGNFFAAEISGAPETREPAEVIDLQERRKSRGL